MKFFLICAMSITMIMASDLSIQGDVSINGKKANSSMKVNLGDFVKTGAKSKVVFKIGQDAFMAKENTSFKISEKNGVKELNVVAGGILSVFKKGSKAKLITENMTAGIRGTGVYIESIDGKSYFCTCYGKTEVETHQSKKHQTFKATHHKMIWVKKDGDIKLAKKMRNHEDDELRELEALVGRVPAFDK